MKTRLLHTNVVLDRVALSKTQLYRLIKAGEFPKPVPIGTQRVAFLESEVADWIERRVRAREAGVGAAARRERAIRAVGARR
jgi:prophage regulatory protein